MDCERVRRAVAAGEFRAPEVARHLEQCRPCAGERERLESALGMLDAAVAVDDTGDFAARVRRSVAALERDRKVRPRNFIAAAAVLASVAALWLGSREEPAPKVESPRVRLEAPSEPEPEPAPMALPPAPVRKVTPTPTPAPEVVVPPGQEELILRVQRELVEGTLSLSPSPSKPAALHIERIHVARLRIDPIEIESRR